MLGIDGRITVPRIDIINNDLEDILSDHQSLKLCRTHLENSYLSGTKIKLTSLVDAVNQKIVADKSDWIGLEVDIFDVVTILYETADVINFWAPVNEKITAPPLAVFDMSSVETELKTKAAIINSCQHREW